MTVRVSDFSFKFTITNFSELKVNVYSPVFSSSNNVLWQLKIQRDKEDYGILIVPIAGPDEWCWNKRSELSINVFAHAKKNGREYMLHDSHVTDIHPDSSICKEFGPVKAFTRSSLKNGELVVGVKINSFEYKSKRCKNNVTLKPIPKSLTNAWQNHMRKYNVDDVKFDVEGKQYYVCSSILVRRSKYFYNMFSGKWSETTNIQNNEKANDINQGDVSMSIIKGEDNSSINNPDEQIKDGLHEREREGGCESGGGESESGNESENDNEINEDTIRYRIKISDCSARIFGEMLSYLYTNEIDWLEEGGITISIGLFCLADKYLLSDLRKRAGDKVIDELDTTNAANIMFGLVPKYDDLKKPVLKFMANNFKEVSQSQGFKDILANPGNYPGFDEILSEVLEEYFKV